MIKEKKNIAKNIYLKIKKIANIKHFSLFLHSPILQ